MNGFIYELFSKNDSLKELHPSKQFKGFCFSNLHKISNQKIMEGDTYKMTISSSNPKIIETLFFSIKENDLIELGEGSFNVQEIRVNPILLKANDLIETLSIINLTDQVDGKIKSVDFEADKDKFISKLKSNLIQKYNQLRFADLSLDYSLFENVEIKFLRKFSIPIISKEHGKFNAIGPKLSFKFNNISPEQLAIFQVCFDAGFGERNSYGMGMMVKR
jgi:CRISPR-associated endoribonuclease Cas6